MKFLKLIFLCIAFFTASQQLAGENPHGITWQTNYDEALKESKATSKPIVLFFTGSDWCSWCNRLEAEALDTQEFKESVGNKFIFVKLDFPRRSQQDAATAAQNKQLQKTYNVRGYPTLVIIDSNQRRLGDTGYKAGGGKSYAAHLMGMVK